MYFLFRSSTIRTIKTLRSISKNTCGLPNTEIKQIKKLKDLNKYLTSPSLVFFDIDNTLLTTRQTMGSDQWFYWHMMQHSIDATLPLYHRAQQITKVRLIEKDTPNIIGKLRTKHLVFAMTSRSKELIKPTCEQIRSIGVTFDCPQRLLNRKSEQSPYLQKRYHNGIFFTNGRCKGQFFEIIYKHLEKTTNEKQELPRHAVLIDDTPSKLEAFAKICKELGINFTAIHYTAMNNLLEVNKDIAEVQEQVLKSENRLISDNEASKYLKKKDIRFAKAC